MREIKKGDRIIQRVNSTEWIVLSVTITRYENKVKMKSVNTGRVVNKNIDTLTEYKFTDTNEWVIPREKSDHWLLHDEKVYICKNYNKLSTDVIASKIRRSSRSVITAVYRIKKDGLFEQYANM